MKIRNLRKHLGMHIVLVLFLCAPFITLVVPNTPAAADALTGTWVDQASIKLSNGDVYTQTSVNGNDMILSLPGSDSGCGVNTIEVNPFQSATDARVTFGGDPTTGCNADTLTIKLDGPNSKAPPVGSGSTGTTTTNGGAAQCPIDKDDGIRWIACPLFQTANVALQFINGLIQNFLFVPTDVIFGTSGGANFQTVFNTFRNVGLSLLVIAGLVMVISEAAGLDIFAAHTVRKALPRIVIAAIGMSLAWPVLQFTITFFNDIGSWVSQIILSATNVGTGSNFGDTSSAFQDSLIVIIALIYELIRLGGSGLASLVGTGLLALLIALIVLAIRQLVILMSVFLAPLAIASAVLPGTERVWKFWRDSLIGALVMFPIIMGFLASGTAMANIAAAAGAKATSQAGHWSWDLLAILVYFAPYFLLPFSFRLASGLMGNIFGLVNDRNKGWFDRLGKVRGAKRAENWQALKAGSRWNRQSTLTRVLGGNLVNRVGARIGTGTRGRFGFGAVGAAVRANNAMLSAADAAKMDHNFAQQLNNEEAMAAIAFGNNRQALSRLRYFNTTDDGIYTGTVNEDRLNRALAAGRTVRATQQMQTAAIDGLARSGKILENRAEFDAMMDQASYGNAALNNALVGNTRFTYRQVGREDLGRNSDYEAIKELDFGSITRQKPKALENLFGIGMSASGGGRTAVIEAVEEAFRRGNAEEAQHMVDNLYAARDNQSLSPEQEQHIAAAISQVSGMTFGNGFVGQDMLDMAEIRYRSKLSDRRVKRDIVLVGKTKADLNLYSFRYAWSDQYYVGVMAQEVLRRRPDAVWKGKDGYYRVDYASLELQMVRLEDWHAEL